MNTTDNKTLKERIVDILDNQDYWIDYDFDTKQAANAIEELFLEEIGKAFDAGYDYSLRKNTPDKAEYLNSITTDTKSLTKED